MEEGPKFQQRDGLLVLQNDEDAKMSNKKKIYIYLFPISMTNKTFKTSKQRCKTLSYVSLPITLPFDSVYNHQKEQLKSTFIQKLELRTQIYQEHSPNVTYYQSPKTNVLHSNFLKNYGKN